MLVGSVAWNMEGGEVGLAVVDVVGGGVAVGGDVAVGGGVAAALERRFSMAKVWRWERYYTLDLMLLLFLQSLNFRMLCSSRCCSDADHEFMLASADQAKEVQ